MIGGKQVHRQSVMLSQLKYWMLLMDEFKKYAQKLFFIRAHWSLEKNIPWNKAIMDFGSSQHKVYGPDLAIFTLACRLVE